MTDEPTTVTEPVAIDPNAGTAIAGAVATTAEPWPDLNTDKQAAIDALHNLEHSVGKLLHDEIETIKEKI